MSLAPKAVIHINFIPGELLFDARPIWTALNSATSKGKVPTLPKELGEELGQTAIHLGTRDYMMRAALRELNASTKAIWEFVPSAIEVQHSKYSCDEGTRCRRRQRSCVTRDGFLPLRVPIFFGFGSQVYLRNVDGYWQTASRKATAINRAECKVG
jgi:hypothetical protein